MIPSIPVTFFACIEILVLIAWGINTIQLNGILSYVFVSIAGLVMIVSVGLLKTTLKASRRAIYEKWGAQLTGDINGTEQRRLCDNYVEEDMMKTYQAID